MARALRAFRVDFDEVDVDVLERDVEGAQQALHLLAQMAACAPVNPSLCQ